MATAPTFCLEKDVINATVRQPTAKRDLVQAKLALQKRSQDTGDSLYDHLTEVLQRVLHEQPVNIVDYFEEFSQTVKDAHFRQNEAHHLDDVHPEPDKLAYAQKILPLLGAGSSGLPWSSVSRESFEFNGETANEEDEEANEEEEAMEDIHCPNLLLLQFYWNLLGIGLPVDDVYLLTCSIHKLQRSKRLQTCRFWGKIFGLRADYLIVEAELSEHEVERRNRAAEPVDYEAEAEEEGEVEHEEIGEEEVEEEMQSRRPQLAAIPKSTYKKPVPIPNEPLGTGLNQKVYYVCNQICDEWTELPLVTPGQVVVSRKIRKFLSGHLDTPIDSYPKFPGNEGNLLRALIARISSTTHISPVGFFKLEDTLEEEAAIEKDTDDGMVPEREVYVPLDVATLLDLNSWVHHRPYILKQGRTKWYDVKQDRRNDLNEIETESVIEEEDDLEPEAPEVGPSLFSPCVDDEAVDRITPWTTRLEAGTCQPTPLVAVESNLWPGAWAFAAESLSDVIYIGWGQQRRTTDYSPPGIPPFQDEFVDEEGGLVEMMDPSVDLEEIWRKILEERRRAEEAEEEGGEEEIGGEEVMA